MNAQSNDYSKNHITFPGSEGVGPSYGSNPEANSQSFSLPPFANGCDERIKDSGKGSDPTPAMPGA